MKTFRALIVTSLVVFLVACGGKETARSDSIGQVVQGQETPVVEETVTETVVTDEVRQPETTSTGWTPMQKEKTNYPADLPDYEERLAYLRQHMLDNGAGFHGSSHVKISDGLYLLSPAGGYLNYSVRCRINEDNFLSPQVCQSTQGTNEQYLDHKLANSIHYLKNSSVVALENQLACTQGGLKNQVQHVI